MLALCYYFGFCCCRVKVLLERARQQELPFSANGGQGAEAEHDRPRSTAQVVYDPNAEQVRFDAGCYAAIRYCKQVASKV